MAQHARHAAVDAEIVDLAAEPQPTGEPEYDIAGNDAPEATSGLSLHQRKSKRMRVALIVVAVVLVALMVALGYFAYQLMEEASQVASQSAASSQAAEVLGEITESKQAERLTAPNLTELLGLTQEQAISKVGRGATVASSKEITQETGEGDDKKTEVTGSTVTIALADQQADSHGNTPSVYLTLNAEGKITQAGYSAALSTMGYGDVSFSDAVLEKHVVETLLGDAGLSVEEGSIVLPDASQYRSFAADGKTITQETYTFEGQAPATSDGSAHAWQCRVNYDYSAANVSNNLADTLRLFYVYVS